jgi:hypothetical protein
MHRPTLLTLGAALPLAACAGPGLPAGPDNLGETSACPVVESGEWEAWIDRMPGPGAEPTLKVAGTVTMPTPGYTFSWQIGPTDRMMPPGQRLRLVPTPPPGMVIQVLTPERVTFSMPAVASEYRTVMVECGGRPLAEIDDIPTVY